MRIKITGIIKNFLSLAILLVLVTSCEQEFNYPPEKIPEIPSPDTDNLVTYSDLEGYPDVSKSDIYEVKVQQGKKEVKLVVFQNSCPVYQLGYMNMLSKDRNPLERFKGRSISWVNFSFSGSVVVKVKVLNNEKVPFVGAVKILPSRFVITPVVEGNTMKFTLTEPGQFSVEIGANGYKNGLMVFANPLETDIPSPDADNYMVLENATESEINSLPATYSGIYFKSGVHDIGVYHVPSAIKNIYLEGGAWVFGAVIMDGKPDVKIFGRGVLSAARLNYRESHTVEAINQSNNIILKGIVVEDSKYFSVRLIGMNNTVEWVKIIGGWTYNVDGISSFGGSNISHCFIWANDDNIKVYRDDITFSDIVCWQLDNGAIIQMSWGGAIGGSTAKSVRISRVDVLHAEWNQSRFNSGLLNCVGNRYEIPGKFALQEDWLIEDVITEGPIPQIINITPDDYTPNHIHGLILKNWNVSMDMSMGYNNYIIGNDPDNKFDGFVFNNFIFNNIKFTESNWTSLGNFIIKNLESPEFH